MELDFELFDREINGREPVAGRDLAADVMTLALQRDFTYLALRNPRVALRIEVDLGVIKPIEKTIEPPNLFDCGRPKCL